MGLFSSIGKLVGGVTGGDLLSAGTSLFAGASARSGQAATNAQSAEEAQRNRDFQERMSSTAHQREVNDLMAAGLNPILSANSGASSPSGSMGSFSNPEAAGIEAANRTASSANAIAMNHKALQKIDAEIDATKASTATSETQAALNRVAKGKVLADTALTNSSNSIAQTNKQLLDTKLPQAKNDADVHSGLSGKILSYLNAIGIGSDAASSAAGLAAKFRGK
jgi:hypothetical protein